MSIFKNSNETAFVDGRKHWTDVIKNSGPGEALIWRQPEEDFNTNSTLLVMPGEQALFIKGGNIEQSFDNGTYKLSTENYPFISRLRNMFSGGVSTFNCVVYFVKTTHTVELKWGTNVQVRDKILGVVSKVLTHGTYTVRISNPGLFLEKMIGNNVSVSYAEDLDRYFANQFQSKIKTVLTKALVDLEQELIGIEARLDEFSEQLLPSIDNIISEYGLKCERFVISAMDVDDSALRQQFDQTNMDAYSRLKMAQVDKAATVLDAEAQKAAKILGAEGDKATMDMLQENWGKLQSAEILKDLANNPGAGGMASMAGGIGLGMAAGNVFGSLAEGMLQPLTDSTGGGISFEGNYTIESKDRFAIKNDIDEESKDSQKSSVEILSELKKLLDAGLISQEQYDDKVKEVLSRM